jgi:putative NADH-flavin reductase
LFAFDIQSVKKDGLPQSIEDYAIALVDEIETPKHPRERFTVGY